jgi:hypothetical protein
MTLSDPDCQALVNQYVVDHEDEFSERRLLTAQVAIYEASAVKDPSMQLLISAGASTSPLARSPCPMCCMWSAA